MNTDSVPDASRRPKGTRAAFTLLELLVSLTVLSLLLLLVFSMIDRTQEGWAASEARVSQFREARNAFELVTRRVSQAVLNSYWDYDRPNNSATATPTAYGRHSELHFVCGPAGSLNLPNSLASHGIFFQAPLGYTADQNLREHNLDSLLNACGYYVEYGGDSGYKPPFVLEIEPNRERFRLMEFRPPAEEMGVYEVLKDVYKTNSNKTTLYKWFATPVGEEVGKSKKEFSRPIAENIIALVFRPKKSELETGIPTDIAPNYTYDTRFWQQGSVPGTLQKQTRNQLPPLIEITMVAVAERSMVRYQQINGETAPKWADGLFQGTANDASYEADLKTLGDRLKADNMDFRVFNETVGIRASKWGED